MKRKRMLLGICALLMAVWLPPAAWADGELEPGFAPRLFKTGWVKAVEVQADGKILIGGLFKTVNGVPRPGLARLNCDGSLDSSFDANHTVIAGDFDLINGIPRPKLARLDADGALDDSFAPQIESRVRGGELPKLAVQPDSKVLVYSQSRNNFLRLLADGREDGSFSLLSSVSFIGADGLIALQADGKILLPNTLENCIKPGQGYRRVESR